MRARRRFSGLALTVLSLAVTAPLDAERLPIKAYTTADGLAHNVVNKIVRDSRGFMWFATNDGLSRFDGHGFQNYSVEAGLPHRTVMDFLETKNGEFWVATFGGLVQFRPSGSPPPRVVSSSDVTTPTPMFSLVESDDADVRASAIITLLEARDGTIWCGTRKGVFRLKRTADTWRLRAVDFALPDEFVLSQTVNDLLEDRFGSIWAATVNGLCRRWRDGAVARYTRGEVPDRHFHQLYEDRSGQLWATTRHSGFFRLGVDEGRNPPAVREHYAVRDGLPTDWVYAVWETSDRRFWVSTTLGLLEFLRNGTTAATRFRGYGRQHGLTHNAPSTLAEDATGNLWMGTEALGTMRLARQGFTTFQESDGVISAYDVFEDGGGALYVEAYAKRQAALGTTKPSVNVAETRVEDPVMQYARIRDRQLEWFQPAPPYRFGCCATKVIRSREGEWWLAGGAGLYRLAAAADFTSITSARLVKIHAGYGEPDAAVMAMFQDSRGDIWISTLSPKYGGLTRWNRETHQFSNLDRTPGLPSLAEELPRSFGEDSTGSVWVGMNTGVARHQNGRFTFFTASDGLPAGRIVSIYPDRAGRLWLASTHAGLVRVDDCASERPRFVTFTTAQGLSGNSIEAITEDTYGRIYAATGRGIDRFDPENAVIEHFSADEGLMPANVQAAFRDRTGALWFGTGRGLARFMPEPKVASSPPTILVTGLVVAGESRPVSAIGETNVRLPDLRHDGNQVEITYVALGSRSTDSLRYQFRLDGTSREWGPLTSRRTVTYASLSPGRYQFQVRAVNPDGLVSATLASVTFTVQPPFWRTWWFLSFMIVGVAASAYAGHRYRVSRLKELERVRTRIARDLHDDVGANLTRIAILSEVARQSASGDDAQREARLSSIGTIARESVSAMSDIVWAISPERETLQEIVRRMRHHVEDVFDGRDVVVTFAAPDESQTTHLAIDVRRDLYLIFKEAVNNASRHAQCTRVDSMFRVSDHSVLLEVTDDGLGFDAESADTGTGLTSMRRRAERIGASFEIASARGQGTRVRLALPAEPPGSSRH